MDCSQYDTETLFDMLRKEHQEYYARTTQPCIGAEWTKERAAQLDEIEKRYFALMDELDRRGRIQYVNPFRDDSFSA